MPSPIVRKLHRTGGSHTVALPPQIIEHMNLATSTSTPGQEPSVQFRLLKGGRVAIESATPAAPKRLKIPTLKALLGNATKEDFSRLRTPYSERAITPEDLGSEAAAVRPDLVAISTGAAAKPRMTRTKPFKRVTAGKGKNVALAAFSTPQKPKGKGR
jgi:antitoxin component of MazEF toxin-antitoxin module